MSKSVWSLVAGNPQEIPLIELTPEACAEIAKAVKEFTEWLENYKPPCCEIDMTTRYW